MEKISKEITEMLVALYKGTDSNRKSSLFPFPTNYDNREWVAATDCRQFIMIQAHEDTQVSQPDFEAFDLARIIPCPNCSISIPVDTVRKVIDNLELIDEEITDECEECDGRGEFRYGSHTYECKECDGEGECGTGEYQKVFDDFKLIRICGNDIEVGHLAKMVQSAELLGANTLTYIGSTNGCAAFKIDELIIIGMVRQYPVNAGTINIPI